MKELYTAPEFAVVCFATEDNITASTEDYGADNGVDIEDILKNNS